MAKAVLNPSFGELTSPQVTIVVSSGILYPNTGTLPASYDTYRTLKKDPTVSLARQFSMAPILAGAWSVEADDEIEEDEVLGKEMKKFIADQLLPLRPRLMETALGGGIDYGWQAYEKVYEEKEGMIILKRLKPLIPDMTFILVDDATGAFKGFRQFPKDRTYFDMPVEKCLLIPFRVEGTDWYGQSLLENIRTIQTKWTDADAGAARYDRKIAGSHFVVYYPPGKSLYAGVSTDNAVIAKDILGALESSGGVSVPRSIAEFMDQADKEGLQWKIEILEDAGGRQPTFVDRLKYLDALKCRGLHLPERAILEGEFGTKAESGEQKDLAVVNMELMSDYITTMINWHVVDHLLAVNYGEALRGKVYLVSSPIADKSLAYLREVYKSYLANPSGFAIEAQNIDTNSLKDKLDIPKSREVARAEDTVPLPGMEPDKLKEMTEEIPEEAPEEEGKEGEKEGKEETE